MEDFFRSGVVFSDVSGPVTRIRHGPGEGQSDDVVITRELVKGVLVPVLAVGVVVQTAHHDRSAGRATGGGGKGVEEKRPVCGQGIDGRGPGNFVSIAPESGRLVVGDKKDDVFLSRKKKVRQGNERRGRQ